MKFFVCIIFILLTACNNQRELNGRQAHQTKSDKDEVGLVYFKFLSNVKLPEKLDFCGENVPLEIDEVRERAEREFYLLLQKPGQIILYLKRAGRLFPMYERVIKEHDLPDDIKYLSVAESALYMARSPKNAVGLWQFIPSTAKAMGLIVNKYVDERRHPEKSTNAAMKYLASGYKKYNSWLIAAGGYNMGHHNMTKHLKYQSADNYFDLFMNEETSRYILRIVIIKELMKNAQKYGLQLDSNMIYKPHRVKYVKVKSIKDIAEWAKSQGTTYKEVRLLNTWILKRKLPAQSKGKTYMVAIPSD